MKCAYCSETAKYSYKYANSIIYSCSNHLENHYPIIGNHKINQIMQKIVFINYEMKEILIDRIKLLKVNAKLDLNDTIAHTNNAITKLSTDLKKFTKYIMGFIKSCDDTINCIEGFHGKIEEKEYYSPIESILIMQESDTLNLLRSPKIKLSPFNQQIIECTPSSFPHCLFQYSFKALSFSDENEIVYNDGKSEIKIPTNFDWAGRLFTIRKDLAMFTGGKKASSSVSVIDLKSKIIYSLSSMHQRRKWHAVAWIDGYPAVLGGHDDEKCLDKVEVYKNGNWEKYPSLTLKKDSCSAVSCFNKVYVFGGRMRYGDNPNKLKSIEKYENRSWSLLSVKLFSPMTSLGLFVSGTYIIIFGGIDENQTYLKDCFVLDKRNLYVSKINTKLEESLFFGNLNFLTFDGEVLIYGNDTKQNKKLVKITCIM
ncbi:hypothetical protein SteCoe_7196 [Stentor coeruleus]|uniref:Kelch motif family protein n=1 Tax=Stentor coeruleus TaxID=5963 RepID=A0A1R2CMZ1_9CILI|nr:hypothetical protein SteCoe_7196 [Stentor coeruleus]